MKRFFFSVVITFVIAVAAFVLPTSVFAQAEGVSAISKCRTNTNEIAWLVQNRSDADVTVSWTQGANTGSFVVPVRTLLPYGEHTFLAPAGTDMPMEMFWSGEVHQFQDATDQCEYHVNFTLVSDVEIATNTVVMLTARSSLDEVVARCTAQECVVERSSYDARETLEVPFGETFTVHAEVFGTKAYAVLSGTGEQFYAATQVPYQKTPLHEIVLGDELEGPVTAPVAQCPDLVLATASDAGGGTFVITVKDSLHGQGNVILHEGEQPALSPNGLWYAAVYNDVLYTASTLSGSEQNFMATFGQDFKDSDPAISVWATVAFKRDTTLYVVEAGSSRPLANDQSIPPVGYANLAWSPDGQYLAFADMFGMVYKYSYGGVDHGVLTSLGYFEGVMELDWGPEWLAIGTRNIAGMARRITLVDPLDPSKTMVISDTPYQENPAFNGRGQLAYSVWNMPDEAYDLYVWSPETGLSTKVFTGASISVQPTWWCQDTLIFQGDIDVDINPERRDMEIFSVPVSGGFTAWESADTFSPKRVQFGPSNGWNQNNVGELYWRTWFDTERFSLGQ